MKYRKRKKQRSIQYVQHDTENIRTIFFGNIERIHLHHIEEIDGKYWYCICHTCGYPVLLTDTQLSNPNIIDCGCQSLDIKHNIDIIDNQFNGLIPRSIKYRKNGVDIYECDCIICGGKTTATETELVNEERKSCGCLASLIRGRKTNLPECPKSELGVSNPKIDEYYRKRNLELSIRTKMEKNIFVKENGDIVDKDGRIYPLRFIKEKDIWVEKQ